MKRSNTWQDAMTTGNAMLDMGDGIVIPLPVDGVFPGEPGPPGPGVPEGGTALQVVRKNAAGTTTEWATPDKAMVGLGNVNNTADSDKPVSEATQDALNGKVSKGELVLNVKDYGAVGDGATNDTPEFATALAAAVSGGASRVFVPRGTYRLLSELTVPSGVTLEGDGAVLDFQAMPDATALGQKIGLKSEGSLGSGISVTTAITQWSRTVGGVSDTTGLAAGDLILISNDEQPVPGMTRADRDKGELNVIQSVDSSTQITLTTGALYAYGAAGIIIRKVTPTENVAVKGISLLMGGVASGHNGIQIRYGRNITIRDVRVDGAEDQAVSLNTVWNGKIQNCTIKNSTSSGTLGNTGYGVAVVEGSRNITVEGNAFDNCRHFVAGGGYWPAAFVNVTGNHGQRSSDAAYDCHESTFYWTFSRNTAVGVAAGFITRGQYITLDGNEVTDSTNAAYRIRTYDGVTEQRGITVRNNRATACTGGVELDGQAAGAEPDSLKINASIVGNKLRNCGANPILLRHFDGAKVSDNEVIGSTGNAVLCYGISSGTPSKSLTISDNTVRDAGDDGIRIMYVDDVDLSGGVIANPTGYGIEVQTCNRTNFSGFTIHAPGKSGMYINAGTVHTIGTPRISGGVVNTYDAIRVTGTSELTITGGYLGSARWAIFTSTTNNVVIAGVNCRGGFTAGRISCDAANQIVANNLVA